ncbi:hypothetical protein AZI98_08910 [Aeribacillus pallidus]|uniref:Phage tail protein n=1 Tax=Aeribacillus pallidus TaxID=33936 RepID=A0A165XLV9_9BACI|nr:tail fiber protein [Aeribacillus pallidus]KZN96173.1 hypothetical protein AZI98_08910 [Aeribacillus pallidus]
MPFDPNNLPEWNAPGVEPPKSKKDSGWGIQEKPPADWFNWFFNRTYNALKSLFTNAQHKEEKGQPNGYASLDGNGKVPSSQLNITKSQVGLGNVDNVKQASKTEFDAHANDTIRHVTQADKDRWNAMLPASNYTAADVLNKIKTVDGSGSGLDADTIDGKHFSDIQADAQAKATTAGQNAINWAKSYGLSANKILAADTDLNTIVETGFYYTNNAINRPSGIEADGNGFLLVQKHESDANYVSQIYIPYRENVVFTRTRKAGSWTSWKQLETTAGAQEKVDAHAADSEKHITAAERNAWNNKFDSSEVVTSAAANKVLKLNASGKLPASITGNADGNAATATKLQTARTLSLSGDVTGSASFDGSANANISATLANSGVTPGTYPKVTVDAKGRVTGGQSLSASDIPNLDWSKITSGKPTTLSGYGITDAIPASQKGAANGVASLDGNTKVPTAQLPAASTSAAGIAQLNDATNSTSTTQAATANAVKKAFDRAVSAENNAKSYTDTEVGEAMLALSLHAGSGGDAHPAVTSSMAGFMTPEQKAKLDGIAAGAEVNQAAFSRVRVGQNVVTARGKTDELELIPGSGITLTPVDLTDKRLIHIQVKDDFILQPLPMNGLWVGSMYLQASQTVTPSKPLSQCRNGWVLVWSDYDPGVGANDADFHVTLIPKKYGEVYAGKIFFAMVPVYATASTVDYVIKKLYIYNDRIVGHDDNMSGNDGNNAFDVVLRNIWEW